MRHREKGGRGEGGAPGLEEKGITWRISQLGALISMTYWGVCGADVTSVTGEL